jgi:hypothetical protein
VAPVRTGDFERVRETTNGLVAQSTLLMLGETTAGLDAGPDAQPRRAYAHHLSPRSLVSLGVTHVAMEATGIYSVPACHALVIRYRTKVAQPQQPPGQGRCRQPVPCRTAHLRIPPIETRAFRGMRLMVSRPRCKRSPLLLSVLDAAISSAPGRAHGTDRRCQRGAAHSAARLSGALEHARKSGG